MASILDINSRYLRFFVAAAEFGSFRKAAAAMETRESAISRRIRDIEEQLGASLFHRHSGGVHLTVAGERFLPRARSALRHLDAAGNDVSSIGRAENGHIKVGIFSTLASGFLFDLIRTFRDHHPRVKIELFGGSPAEHVAAVRQLKLDVAFVTKYRDLSGCESEMFWNEQAFAVLPAGHRLEPAPHVHWHDLADEQFVVSNAPPGPEIQLCLIRNLSELGVHPDIESQSIGRNDLMSLVALGLGVTLTSEAAVSLAIPGIIYRPIVDESVQFWGVWSRHNDNPACRRLLSLARARSDRLHHKKVG